jgi:GAF domain-containing protein
MTPDEKRSAYRDLLAQIDGLLESRSDSVALMANVASALHDALPYASWTGFYRVVEPGLLRVGPFQGPVACVDIPFGRGVCGTAATTGETQLVEDVHSFAGHIACDASARSEIVVPLVDEGGQVFAVLDVDSHDRAAFDDLDRRGLEELAERIAHYLSAA